MLKITKNDYVQILEKMSQVIGENGDYITSLDAATGDGDHWANINMGFQKLMNQKQKLLETNLSDLMKEIAMILMSGVGGSSGVLYGSAYLEASKRLSGAEMIDDEGLAQLLEAWLDAMMKRGGAKPGDKTMLDALFPAAEAYRQALNGAVDSRDALFLLRDAANKGAENTKKMEAVRGRACYQKEKGVGHLDPGAVTMAMQLVCIAEYSLEYCVMED